MASIIKVLEEIVHTEEKLVEKSPPKTAIQNGSPVLLAAGYGLKIVLVNGARIGNGITCSDKSADKQALFEIGRASCRERVEVSGVDVALKKKQISYGI